MRLIFYGATLLVIYSKCMTFVTSHPIQNSDPVSTSLTMMMMIMMIMTNQGHSVYTSTLFRPRVYLFQATPLTNQSLAVSKDKTFLTTRVSLGFEQTLDPFQTIEIGVPLT